MENYTDISDLVDEVKNAPSPFLTYDADSAGGLSRKEQEPPQNKEFLLGTDAKTDAELDPKADGSKDENAGESLENTSGFESNPEAKANKATESENLPDNEEINIEVKPDTIELDKELEDIGVESTGSSAFTPAHDLKLPVSDEVIYAGRKKPISTADRWSSEFYIYLLHRVHTGLKKIRGKIVRVVKGNKRDILDMPDTPESGTY